MKYAMTSFGVIAALISGGCLPGDIRPEPGRVYVSAEASSKTTEGFTTDDGWAIHFDRVLVGLGDIGLAADPCTNYANAGYDRLFDFAKPGRQKLGEVYGLGGCEIQFQFRPPSSDALLENGVTAADRDFMRMLPPNYVDNEMGPPPRTAMYVRGSATKANETKHFEWKFVARYGLSDCADITTGEHNTFLQLKGGDYLKPVVSFHAEDLFRSTADATAPIVFDAFAAADANADGNITLDEVGTIPAPITIPDGGIGDDAGASLGDLTNGLSGLAAFIQVILLPGMVYYDEHRCQALPQRTGRGGGPF